MANCTRTSFPFLQCRCLCWWILVLLPIPICLCAQKKDSSLRTPVTLAWELSDSAFRIQVSGTLLLQDYQPLQNEAHNSFDLYAAEWRIHGESKDKKLGFHVEIRGRASKLRPFYKSNFWFQQAYLWYHSSMGNLKVGKIYRQLGMFWDGSFWGNLLYFNGLKLNPDYGLAWSRQQPLSGKSKLSYSLQYFYRNDQVDGALQGRDVESDTGSRMLQAVTFRIQSRFYWGDRRFWTLGLSGLSEKIQSAKSPSFSLHQIDSNLAVQLNALDLFGEVLYQKGLQPSYSHPPPRQGYADSRYFWVGCHYQVLPSLKFYLSYSQVRYLKSSFRERELLPGMAYWPRPDLALIGEYDFWKRYSAGNVAHTEDNSMNLILNYGF